LYNLLNSTDKLRQAIKMPIIAPILALIITNLLTYYCIKRKFHSQSLESAKQSDELKSLCEGYKQENQGLKQDLADLKYKHKELEKDLAAAQRNR